MPIPFACPHCGLETFVDDEYAGESGPCAACGKDVTVPWQASDTSIAGAQLSVGYIILLAIGGLGAVAIVISIAGMVFFPAIRAARTVAQGRSCEANLHKIWLAMQSYEEEHGTLPPAYIPDDKGKPMHSWRVLLLPFLDEEGLYSRYDFNEPWDGPNNIQLQSYMPEVYGCPADVDARMVGETSYMLLVGEETFFPDADVTSVSDLRDDPATTILVAEMPVAGVGWLEPRDLKAERMQFIVNGGFGLEVGSYHEDGAHVVMADGTVQFLSEGTPADYVEGMSTIDGDEPIPAESLDGY